MVADAKYNCKEQAIFASVLVNPKYSKYQDFQQQLTLRKNIADLTPYEVTLPDPPRPEEFVNFGLPIEEQFFVRETFPAWLVKLNKLSKQKSAKKDFRQEAADIAHRNKEYREYIADKWRKRKEGIWIYINGKPCYIPGNMWFYLYCYHIFGYGLPDFRAPDMEWWYWSNICVDENPRVYGSIEMAMRRDGKTSRHASNYIEKFTRNREFLMGFVGRSTKDSKAAFFRAYISSIRRLPFFFTPLIDAAREYPASEMHFRSPDDIEEGLLSRLDLRATVKTAYDGEPLGGLHLNEAGKIEEMLVTEFWGIHKECMQERGKIKGKACLESTVEETNVGGMKEFIPLFRKSDHHPSKLNERGETETGLIAYFRPAWESYVFDQYGNAIIDDPTPAQAEYRKRELLKEKNGHELVKQRDHLKGGKQLIDERISSQKDANERQKVIRKYPRTIREAFRSDGADCQFNREKIESRLDDFLYGNKEILAFKISWRNNIPDTTVDVTPVEFEDGLVQINQTMGMMLIKKNLWPYLQKIMNNTRINDGWRVPGNKQKGILVCDPYKYDADATESDRKSLGVAHGYLLHDSEIDHGQDEYHWRTKDLFMEFAYRGPVDDFDEYMMMLATLWGMKFSPETNSGDVLPQFSRRRYDKFLYFEPKVTVEDNVVKMDVQSKNAGFITLGDNTRIPLFNSVRTYIDECAHKCVFSRFLENSKEVEPNSKSMTKKDYFMSGGNAIRIGELMSYKRVDKPAYYICEFHPTLKLLAPGECPHCGERLTKETAKGFQGMIEPMSVKIT